MTKRAKWVMFFVLIVAPSALTYVTLAVSFNRAKEVEFCASCHVMTPFVEDLSNPESETLAARHWDRRWIAHSPCYTCHTDYDFLGPLNAKITGMRHIGAYYLTPERAEPPTLYSPYKNGNCLSCHEKGRAYRENPIHELSMDEIASGETSCLECHGPAHPGTGEDGS